MVLPVSADSARGLDLRPKRRAARPAQRCRAACQVSRILKKYDTNEDGKVRPG